MPLFLALIIALVLIQAPAQAADTTTVPTPHIEIEQLYAFATMPGGVTGAAFMTLKNTGDIDDVLIGVESDIAKITEIHENFINPDDGMMMMRKIKDAKIPSHGEVTLEPKGKHIMLIQLKEPLTLDSTFPITLIFEKSEKKIVNVKVIQPGGTPDMMDNMHHHH